MEEKAFHSILADYQKTHPGKYRNYPCPKCGAPISINFERSSIWAFWAIRMNVQIPIAIIPGTTFVIPNQQKER